MTEPTQSGVHSYFRTMDRPQWVVSLAEEMKDSMLSSLREGRVPGMPATWNYGPISLSDYIPSGNGGGLSGPAWAKLTDWVNRFGVNDADAYNTFGLGPPPAATPNDMRLTAAESAAQLAADKFGLSVRQQQFAEAKFAIEMAASQAPRSTSRSSGGSSGGGGGGGGGGSAVDYAAKLGYAQSAGQLELDFARQKMQMELDFLKQKYAMASDPNSIENQHWQAQFDEQKRQHDSTLAYQAQRDQRAEQLARAETTAKLGANPGDAVQREIFLRTGKEPVGTPQSVWTGQPTGSAPTTLSQLMTQLSGAGVFGKAPTLPTGTPTTVPYNTDPMNQPPPPTAPPEPPPPAFAFGTQRPRSEITPDGWTRAQEFISGDPQVPSRPNPERVQLRVVNGEPQAKVTPLSSPPQPNTQAFAHANSNARFMSPPPPRGMRPPPPRTMGQRHRMLDGSMMAGPPMYSYGTDEEWAATQKAVDDYYASQAQQQIPNESTSAYDIYNPGRTWDEQLAIWNSPTYDGGPTGRAGTNFNDGSMTQAEQDAAKVASLTPDRIAGGVTVGGATTQGENPYAPNYTQPADWPAPPTAPPPLGTAATAGPTAAPTTAATAPQQPAQQAYWGTQALNPGLQTITNSPFVPYASIGNPANVQIMDTTTGQYRALRPGEDIPAGATVGVLGPVGATGTGGAPSGATGAPGAATTPPSSGTAPQTSPREVVISGISQPAAMFGTADSYGNAAVTTDGFVKTPDGGGWYKLEKGDYRRPDGSYIRYNPILKSYKPVEPSVTWISSMAQFYQLPPNIQQDILQGKPTGYFLNDRGIDMHIMSKMIADERQRIADKLGVDVRSLPKEATQVFEAQYFGGLEPGRVYPGGWVSSMMAPYNRPTGTMLTRDQFLALPADQQRSLLDGFTGTNPSDDPLRQYRESTGIYNPGSQNYSATGGPVGGMPTGLFTLPQGEPDSRAFNYRQYLAEADYRRLYPEFFNQRPQPVAPTPVGLPPQQGNSGDRGQPPGPAAPGMKWVWVD